jgi:hypothetical protein
LRRSHNCNSLRTAQSTLWNVRLLCPIDGNDRATSRTRWRILPQAFSRGHIHSIRPCALRNSKPRNAKPYCQRRQPTLLLIHHQVKSGELTLELVPRLLRRAVRLRQQHHIVRITDQPNMAEGDTVALRRKLPALPITRTKRASSSLLPISFLRRSERVSGRQPALRPQIVRHIARRSHDDL